MGAPRRRRCRRVPSALHRRPGQEETRRRAEEALEERGRALARDRRRPRRRSDRLASARGAEADRSRAAHGLPRDHEGRDQPRARRDARDRRASCRRAGDAPHPRPPLRLRGLARSLEEDHPRALGGTRAVGRDAARRRARARADGVQRRKLVGHRCHLRSGVVPRAPRLTRRQAPRARARLRQRRQAEDRRRAAARRGRCARPRAAARAVVVQRHPRRAEAVLAPAEPAVHDVDAAAGGEPQAPLLRADDDAHRAAPVRERLHHLHAHRLDDAVRVRAHRRAQPGARPVRRRLRPRRAAPLRAKGEERAGGPRGDPACRRRVPLAEAGRKRAEPRRERALRADLDAHDRLADEGRSGADGLASHRRHVVRERARRVRRVRHRDHVPRLPRRVRGGPRHRRGGRDGGGRAAPPECQRRRCARARRSSSRRGTRRIRRLAIRRRRSCARSRSSASAARRRTRRSSARSSTAATSSRRALRSSRRFSPSRS